MAKHLTWIKLFAFALLYICIWANVSPAQAFCPERIGYIEKNVLSKLTLPIIRKVYEDLGCSSKFIALPGRRALSSFNQGQIDAEVFRLALVEKKYQRAFLRSQNPVLQLYSYLWVTPDYQETDQRPLGYVKGILWEENYVKGKRFSAFHNTTNLLKAYNSGKIAGFLGSGTAIRSKKNTLSPPPIPFQQVHNAPLYHYTQEGYDKFIILFDKYLEQHKPFAEVSAKMRFSTQSKKMQVPSEDSRLITN
ncbi:hypothetical protein [Terasakiella sp.]|uniref:hypothetical protein n=1 Tax=Terasakiella sp. TaxID=2034861 RepID=UPI003AA9B339